LKFIKNLLVHNKPKNFIQKMNKSKYNKI